MRIEVRQVSFAYPSGVEALTDIDLTVEAGERLAMLGENGAGKTTLAKHLNGLLKPSQGSVHIGDWDTRQHSVAQLARRVAYVFQNPDEQLFERTVRREVAFGPRNLGGSPAEIDRAVEDSLALVGLADRADTHPYDLQPAERKWVAFAAALAMGSPVLLLDEPTTGQDAAGIQRLGSIVEDLKQDGRTLITITHDVEFCADHFDRVVVLSGGHIVADGPAREVLVQRETLASAGVEPPQLVRLAWGLGMGQAALHEGEFITRYAEGKGQAKEDRA